MLKERRLGQLQEELDELRRQQDPEEQSGGEGKGQAGDDDDDHLVDGQRQ